MKSKLLAPDYRQLSPRNFLKVWEEMIRVQIENSVFFDREKFLALMRFMKVEEYR